MRKFLLSIIFFIVLGSTAIAGHVWDVYPWSSGAVSGPVYLDENDLVFDKNRDTYIDPSENALLFYIGGNPDFYIYSDTWRAEAGSSILTDTLGDTSGSGITIATAINGLKSILYRTPDIETTAGTGITVDASEAVTTVDAEGSSGNITITVSNAVANKPFLIRVIQGSVARTVTITGAIYPGGSAYAATATNNAIDQIVCYPTSNAVFECSYSLDYK